MAKLAPSGASDAWRGEIPLSTPANQQAGKPPYLSPEGERATSHNVRSEEHTSALQSLMRISYAVFCLKKPTLKNTLTTTTPPTNKQYTQQTRITQIHNNSN